MTNYPLPTNDPTIVDFAAGDNLVVIHYVDGTIKVWDTVTYPETSTPTAPYTIATPPTAIHKIAAGQIFNPPSLWNRYHALLDANGVIQITQPKSEGKLANTDIAKLIPASLQGQTTDIFILEQGLYAVHTNGTVYAINHEQATIVATKGTPIHIGGGLCRGIHAEDVFYTVFLYQDGTISVDGPPMYQPPANLPSVKAISASSSHTLALLHDGTVVAWGDNQLGACDVPADLANVVAITAGEDYSVALLADGTIRGWGENGEGQYAFPADLPKVRQVKAAIYQTYVLTESGSVIKSHHPTHFDVPEDLRV
jgi:hypothetical protein